MTPPSLSSLLRALTAAAMLMCSPSVWSASEIKIGFLTTLSGPGAGIGLDIRDAFQLAIKQNGGRLGGLPVKLTVTDDQTNPVSARQTIDRYIKRDKVDIVTGMVFSSVVLPVLPAVLESKTLFISTNTGPADYAGAKCDPNFFAIAWQNEDLPQAMGAFANEQNYRRIALIAPNYPGGRETLQGFKRRYTGQVVEEIYTKLNQLDYAAEIATLRRAQPDAVFYFLPGGMGINFVKQYRATGMQATPLLTYSADTEDIRALGKDLVGIYNAAQWAIDLDNPVNKAFVAAFQQEYGRMPSMYAAQGFDAAMLIDGAVRDVRGNIEDHAALLAALKKANFQSVRGPFRFNNNHYPIHDIHMRVFAEDGQGNIINKWVSRVIQDLHDPFAAQCPMR